MTVLTHQEAAAFLKVNEATLRKLRRRGDIHGTLVGAQYRYLLEHLEAYLRGPVTVSTSKESDGTRLPSSVHVERPAIDRPKRPVHHRPFYALQGRDDH